MQFARCEASFGNAGQARRQVFHAGLIELYSNSASRMQWFGSLWCFLP